MDPGKSIWWTEFNVELNNAILHPLLIRIKNLAQLIIANANQMQYSENVRTCGYSRGMDGVFLLSSDIRLHPAVKSSCRNTDSSVQRVDLGEHGMLNAWRYCLVLWNEVMRWWGAIEQLSFYESFSTFTPLFIQTRYFSPLSTCYYSKLIVHMGVPNQNRTPHWSLTLILIEPPVSLRLEVIIEI